MRSKKIKFNWSKLDRKQLFDIIYQAKSKIVNKDLTPSQLRNILNFYITKEIPVKIKKKLNFSVRSGWIYVGGCYYSDSDRLRQPCIEINFDYCPFDETICLSRYKFLRICRTFADVMLHEIIHMRQFRRRRFEFSPDYQSDAEIKELQEQQKYFGSKDEIDAYAFNIACELLDNLNGDKKAIVKHVNKKNIKTNYIKSPSLKTYLQIFEHDHNHDIIISLKKKVIKYLPNAELGKPYRNKNWIDY